MGVKWDRCELQYLRWYAERGLSGSEAAILLNHRFGRCRTKAAVITKAFMLDISFHSADETSGAPWGNRHGLETRMSEMRQPTHHWRAQKGLPI